MNLLVIDNFDSFTYMLVDYLQQAGANCQVVRNNEPWHSVANATVDGVVLSPGPGVPRQAGLLVDVIDQYHQRVPMLGVCLGHQALGEFFGARLIPAAQPMHGKVSTVYVHDDDALWQNVPTELTVTRYHSLLLTDMPLCLVTTATTASGEIMAFRHQRLPIWGVQFHPEAALTQYGLLLIQNWIEAIRFTYTIRTTTSLINQYA